MSLAMVGLVAVMRSPLPWGKKPCKDWLHRVKNRGLEVRGARLVGHPLHLRWAAVPGVVGEPFDLNVANSATLAYALVCDWRAAFDLAHDLDTPQPVRAFWSDGAWQADAADLELVVAHALRDLDVLVEPAPSGHGADLDATKCYAFYKRRSLASPLSVAKPEQQPDFVDPANVMCSRDLEACVWPKCYHFAQRMSTDFDSFGLVPLRWIPEAGRWSVGNRHRPMAAMLAGRSFQARYVRR